MEVQQVLEAQPDQLGSGGVLEPGALVTPADGSHIGIAGLEFVEAVGPPEVVDDIKRVEHVDAVGWNCHLVDQITVFVFFFFPP